MKKSEENSTPSRRGPSPSIDGGKRAGKRLPLRRGNRNNVLAEELVRHARGDSERSTIDGAMRALVESNKGELQEIAAREPFDGIMNSVVAPEGVTFDSDTVGGVVGSIV